MHTIPQLTLGAWLREARRSAGLLQQDAANHVHVSRPLVSRWESGTSTPNVRQFKALSDLYAAPWLMEVLDYACAA